MPRFSQPTTSALLVEGAVDVGGRETVRARAHREARAPQILRLHREQPIADRDGVGRALLAEKLAGEPGLRHVHGRIIAGRSIL